MTDSNNSGVSSQDSVYYLSLLASRLQTDWDDHNLAVSLAGKNIKGPSSTAQFLNHFSTCLSRGKGPKTNFTVVVTVGSIQLTGVGVSVVSRSNHPGRPKWKAGYYLPDDPLGDKDYPSSRFGFLRYVIGSGEGYHIPISPSDFQNFVFESLTLLRAASSRINAQPDHQNNIVEAVVLYFVASCWQKIQARHYLLAKTYVLSLLGSWNGSYAYNLRI
ncbi:hypothetical protein B0H11DRAFT_2190995 [Mycena galericulata]|nr:hypothetical protein B0H11DRAFT_2190995 [Mycena galericulata]